MGKKNLDKLFQEKFSDFSEVPDEKVWQSIEASLDKKKKSRRVIPIWWKLGGIAAILIFALYLINPFEGSDINTPPTVTDIETLKKESEESQQVEGFINSATDVVDVDKQNVLEDKNITKDTTTDTPEENGKTQSLDTDPIGFKAQKNQNQIASEDTSIQKQSSKNNFTANPSIGSNPITKGNEDAIADAYKTKSQNAIEKSTDGEAVSDQSMNSTNLPIENDAGIAKGEEKAGEIKEIQAVKKKSIFDEIADQEAEKEEIADAKGGKWSAGPSVAPVYFDAIGEGSPVHSIFVPNSKSGDLNLSYGLAVAYEISDKLKIRSGVHRVDYGYSTNEVEFSSSLESSAIGQIANVNYSATAKNIVVGSNASESGLEAMVNDTPIAQEFSSQGLAQSGAMSQQFGYLEVPVELEYALLDKKFGINLIGGVSSLFLVDNSISLTAGELTTEMGEANNVNDVNFSTNVGIGLNYQFTPKVQLNVEPVFKYQLNTFSQTDGTFQPFTIGVYSGISFRF